MYAEIGISIRLYVRPDIFIRTSERRVGIHGQLFKYKISERCDNLNETRVRKNIPRGASCNMYADSKSSILTPSQNHL